MNRLRPFTMIGYPFHGLAVNGTLTHVTGDKPVNGDGGNIVVRHPAAPVKTRSPGQLIADAANNLEWRNYALLCGSNRAVNGGAELGSNAWLYCAPDGRTWIVTVDTSVVGDTLNVEVWRRKLFGLWKHGTPYAINDELLVTQAVQFVLPVEYVGAITANECAADAGVPYAACIVPDPAGSSVYVHVLCDNDVYDATKCQYHGDDQSLYAIIELDLSGSGDPDNGGVGISCTVPNVDLYDDLVVTRTSDKTFGQPVAIAYPDGTFTSTVSTYDDPPPAIGAGDPCPIGQTYEEVHECQPVNSGVTNQWQHGPALERHSVIHRTHHGDLVRREAENYLQLDYNHIVPGDMRRTVHWLSVDDGNNGCQWQIQGFTDEVTARQLTYAKLFGDGGFGYDFNGGQISEGAFWSYTEAYTESYSGFGTGKPCSTYGYTGSLVNVPHAAELTFSGGALTNGMTVADLDIRGGVSIWPGVIIAGWNFKKPDNSGSRVYHSTFIGLGEAGAQAMYSNDFETFAIPPGLGDVVTGWSFQPVTMEWHSSKGNPVNVYQYC